MAEFKSFDSNFFFFFFTQILATQVMTSQEIQTISEGGRTPIVDGLESYILTVFGFLVAGHLITT
jgi:hypothetical protein